VGRKAGGARSIESALPLKLRRPRADPQVTVRSVHGAGMARQRPDDPRDAAPERLTAEQVAALLRIDLTRVEELTQRGELAFERHWVVLRRYRRDDVEAYRRRSRPIRSFLGRAAKAGGAQLLGRVAASVLTGVGVVALTRAGIDTGRLAELGLDGLSQVGGFAAGVAGYWGSMGLATMARVVIAPHGR
jgi:hypothetical protein